MFVQNCQYTTGLSINEDEIINLNPESIAKYESPITIIDAGFRTEVEDNIMKAIAQYGISVDKNELLKALDYDRGQFKKGYNSGYQDGFEEGKEYSLEQIKKLLGEIE